VATVIECPRLLLHELTVADARELLLGRNGGRPWAAGYPTEGSVLAARWYVERSAHQPPTPGFGMYQIVRRADRRVVGDIGFHGPPQDGVVTVGYGLAESSRGQGYATEALAGLATWALGQPDVGLVRADAAHDNGASQRVMRRAGFRHVGDDETLRYFELCRPADPPLARTPVHPLVRPTPGRRPPEQSDM
jgi:RimJ/RimL family protein N-acetyltransferase